MILESSNLYEIVSLVEAPNKDPVIDAYIQNAERIAVTPGSKTKHQAWKGGYLDHVVYATNYALALHKLDKEIGFNPDHTKGDIALVMLLHDFGKIVRYKKVNDGWEYVENPDVTEREFFESVIQEHNFKLTKEQKNALEFIHGEGTKHTPEGRVMRPLAVVCHNADIWSARAHPDNPLLVKDPWRGVRRHSEIPDLVKYLKELKGLKSS